MDTQKNLNIKTFTLTLLGVILLWLPVLWLHLTIVLFSALTVYGLTLAIDNALQKWLPKKHGTLISVLLLLAILVLIIVMITEWLGDRISTHSFSDMMLQAALVLDQLHAVLPNSMSKFLPETLDGFNAMFSHLLKTHATQIQTAGVHTLRGIGHLLAGMVIGALAAIQLKPPFSDKPLAQLLRSEFQNLLHDFNQVFFAQVRISALNTFLTAIYLLGVMPLMGKPLPLSGTLVVFTFFAGLLPVVGNLISNTFIMILSLNHGVTISTLSLLWLMGIHKLEYFLNAHFIGHKIKASAWEALLAMLVLESAFGLAGLISAPIIYAQIKSSLMRKMWL